MSTMLRFKELQMRNFLSYGNQTTVVDLTYSGSTLILGENLDTGGNNGCGKTSTINALCYALYNKPLDNISLQRLINTTNSTKNTLMEVRLTFDKGADEFEIYRCRGETTNIQILMNGEDITLDSVIENDRLVAEIVGISYDLFTKVVIFSGNSQPFLMMPVSQQRQQIEELFNITLLTEKAQKLKEIIKNTENDINIQSAIIKEQEAQRTLLETQVREAEGRVARWETDTQKQIRQLEDQLEMISSVDMQQERELHEIIETLDRETSKTAAQHAALTKDRTAVEAEVKKLAGEIAHLVDDKCPYCLQQYAGAGDKLTEKQNYLAQRQSKLDEIVTSIEFLQNGLDDLRADLAAARAEVKFKTLADAVKAETNAASAQERIESLKTAKNPHIEALNSLKSTTTVQIKYEDLDVLKRDLEHQQFLVKLLTDKNSFIRRSIINKTVPFLNARLNENTKQLGLPHVVKFDDDMGCTVSEYGRELDYGNLSSGEKKRVNLAMSLAFRDVLHHLHCRVNCLFIDEIDASLDGSGVEAVFKLLKNKCRDGEIGTWIISHRPEAIGRFDRTQIIRKENGFSRIVEDELEEVDAVVSVAA